MPPRLLVGGSIAANYLSGGIAWERLSWVLGLRTLGVDVLLVDQLDRARCLYPEGAAPTPENSLNLGFFEEVVQQFGLCSSAVLVDDEGRALYGLSHAELLERAEHADALVNIAGNIRLEDVKRRSRLRVYVDVDPGFTQLWLASGRAAPRIADHDLYFTIGENVGTSHCSLPTGGIEWRHTRQPVLLDEWPVSATGDSKRFTTIATWRGFGPHGPLESLGFRFTEKADEFAKLIELPHRVPHQFEIALRIDPTDEESTWLLECHGWQLTDPFAVARSPDSFRHYVQTSGAEFCVAKGAYVETGSGWFSDRTTRYLASGKPALVQDTGFGRTIPMGDGLFAFRTLQDAIDGALRIQSDYARHCSSARRLAEEYFDSHVVMRPFLDDVMAVRPRRRRTGHSAKRDAHP
jgi:hypothetical protein